MTNQCRLCLDLNFSETTLCELNRSVQPAESEFKCQAFRPRVSLITAAGETTSGKPTSHRDESVLARQLQRLKALHADKDAVRNEPHRSRVISNAYQWQRALYNDVVASFVGLFIDGKEHLNPQFQPAVNA